MSYDLKSVQIELCGICNATCKYCTWQTRVTGKVTMDKKLAMELIKDCVSMGVETVRYHHTGESLLHPDAVSILEAGCWSIGNNILSTNCYLLNGPRATALRELDTLSIVCSVHWGMHDSFIEKVIRNIKSYVASGFRNRLVTIQMVCAAQAQAYVDRFVSEFEECLQADRVRLFFKQPLTWPTDSEPNYGFIPDVEARPGMVIDRTATPVSIGIGCTMPTNFLAVMADGTVAPCCVGQQNWGLPSAKDLSLDEIWDHPRMKEIRRAWRQASGSVPCGHCIRREDCTA